MWRHSIINIFKMREKKMNTPFTLSGYELKPRRETTEHISKSSSLLGPAIETKVVGIQFAAIQAIKVYNLVPSLNGSKTKLSTVVVPFT